MGLTAIYLTNTCMHLIHCTNSPNTYTHMHTHARTHACMHTHAHTHTHTRTHTHTHACTLYTQSNHTWWQSSMAAINILNPEEPKLISTALMYSRFMVGQVRKLQRTLSKVFPRSYEYIIQSKECSCQNRKKGTGESTPLITDSPYTLSRSSNNSTIAYSNTKAYVAIRMHACKTHVLVLVVLFSHTAYNYSALFF